HHVGGDAGRGRGTRGRIPPARGSRGGDRAAARAGQEVRALVEDHAGRRHRSAVSGCHPARRPGAARVGCRAAGRRVSRDQVDRGDAEATPARMLSGPYTATGLAAAVVAALLDQAVKLWLLFGIDLANHGNIRLGPFIDIVLVWNTGISYGWFQQ